MTRECRPWTVEEDIFLYDHYAEHGPDYCAEHLGRTWHAVTKRASRLELTRKETRPAPAPRWGEPWTTKEDKFLLDHYTEQGPRYCAEHLGRPYAGTFARAQKIGAWSKSYRAWTPEADSYVRNNYPHRGAAHCATVLGRTVSAISNRAQALGVRREGR